MQRRVLEHPKVTVHFNTTVVDAYADRRGQMAGLNLQNGAGWLPLPFHLQISDEIPDSQTQLPVRGLFYGIGHTPNSDLIKGQVELDEEGYVKTEGRTNQTSSS